MLASILPSHIQLKDSGYSLILSFLRADKPWLKGSKFCFKYRSVAVRSDYGRLLLKDLFYWSIHSWAYYLENTYTDDTLNTREPL